MSRNIRNSTAALSFDPTSNTMKPSKNSKRVALPLPIKGSSAVHQAVLGIMAAGAFALPTKALAQSKMSKELSGVGFSAPFSSQGSGQGFISPATCPTPGSFDNVDNALAPVPDTAPNAAQCNLPGITAQVQHGVGTRLVVEFDRDTLPADGQSASNVTIRLLDANGRLVTGSNAYQQVTLELQRGRWNVEDSDPNEPGVQVQLQNGQAQVKLIAHHEPGEVAVKFSSGNLSVGGQFAYTPDLRPMIAAGIVEGIINFRKGTTGMFAPAHRNAAFEKELTAWSRESVSGDKSTTAAAHASLFLKGTIKGEYLLTLGADSDKETRAKLLRDVKAEEIYPVYGDASIKGWETQSKSKIYVRVDKNRSYALWGDYSSQDADPGRVLGQYSRSLTGAKWHLEGDSYKLNVFASQDAQRQTVEEQSGMGISGPYRLGNGDLVAGSDKIEVITRDRNQPSIILKVENRIRGVDYDIDPIGGTVLFTSPIPSRDANFNPVSIRTTYERETGGKKFLIAGVDGQVKLGSRVQVGASYVTNKDPSAPYQLASVNVVGKITDTTVATVELAKSHQDVTTSNAAGIQTTQALSGTAVRAEVLHQSQDLSARVFYTQADKAFIDQAKSASNAQQAMVVGPTPVLTGVSDVNNNGRTEAGLRLAYKFTQNFAAKGELTHSKLESSGTQRQGLYGGLEYKITPALALELGLKKSEETGQILSTSAGNVEQTSLVGKVTGKVTEKISVVGELERSKGTSSLNTNSSTADRMALGLEYQVHQQGVIYAKHERIDSHSGLYGLNAGQSSDNTVVGYRHNYNQDTNMFSEYRLRDGISGHDGAAAYGVRHGWNLTPDLKMTAALERLHCIQGCGPVGADTTAASLGMTYTGSDRWKASGKIEFRDAGTSETWLLTAAGGLKMSRDFTGLGKFSTSRATAPDGSRTYDNLQLGIAYRQTDLNRWNALAKVQFIRDRNSAASLGAVTNNNAVVGALTANYQPTSRFVMSGRLAMKNAKDSYGSYSLGLGSLRATYDLTDRIDVGAIVSHFQGQNASQTGVGLEAGYMLGRGLWASVGFNWFEVKDKDLLDSDYGNKGLYLRLRYKFDESLFQSRKDGNITGTTAPNTEQNNQGRGR